MEPRDQVLVRETLGGSREAFGLLVVRYSRSVRALCLARLGTANDLDDLVQESFLRAYKGLARLKQQARFGAYLHRIARNICVDWLRRHRREPVPIEDEPVDLSIPSDGPADVREERLEELRSLVGRLPLALREAVMLFYFEKRSYEQIAEFLDISAAAVNQRLHRARVSLRATMGADLAESAEAPAEKAE
jgi:RNA polymerase sigma-70 factor (ECF subfamily)